MSAPTISIPGGESFKLKVYGSATVKAGSGNDTIDITKTGKIVIGDGNNFLTIGKNGTVKAGSGNDSIDIGKSGRVTIGGGNDTINFGGSGVVKQTGLGGHDTINFGSGNDTVIVEGQASVHGSFGDATITGGKLTIGDLHGGNDVRAVSGDATLVGGTGAQEFFGGTGNVQMDGGKGNDTLVGGTGFDTMHGGSGHDVFSFVWMGQGGQHLITDFVHGQDKLYLEGHSLSWLESHNSVSTSGGNTYISLDGGKTQVELKGVTHLTDSDVTTHKP
jgi:Ca2+-binding RTX toxin-like protein